MPTTSSPAHVGDAIEAAATENGHPAAGALLRVLADRGTHDPDLLLRVANNEDTLNALYTDVIGRVVDLLGELVNTPDFQPAPTEKAETPVEVTWAEDYGDGLQFILRDGSFGNPGCDDCGSDDAVARADGVYLCTNAAADRCLIPPGGWQRIAVTETVRAWGFETSTYQTMYSIDQIRARVAADTGEDATDSAVAEWLSENLIPVESDLELQEILDRDSLYLTTETPKPPTGVGGWV